MMGWQTWQPQNPGKGMSNQLDKKGVRQALGSASVPEGVTGQAISEELSTLTSYQCGMWTGTCTLDEKGCEASAVSQFLFIYFFVLFFPFFLSMEAQVEDVDFFV